MKITPTLPYPVEGKGIMPPHPYAFIVKRKG